jgi:hypothetical protein
MGLTISYTLEYTIEGETTIQWISVSRKSSVVSSQW